MSGASALGTTLDAEKTRRAGGASGEWQPGDADRATLAQRHGLTTLDALAVAWQVTPRPHGRFTLAGRIAAALTQPCVVSLEPVPQAIDDAFEAQFWPADQVATADPDALADAPEAIEAGVLDLGRVLAEEFGVRIEPFPRCADATLPAAAEDESAHPFAALRALRS